MNNEKRRKILEDNAMARINGSDKKLNSMINLESEEARKFLNSQKLFNRAGIDWYDRFNRYGCLDPYNNMQATREVLFFTKPDLHILGDNELQNTDSLNPDLANIPFFQMMIKEYPQILYQLQLSASKDSNPFMAILSNSVKSTLDLPDINGTDTTTGSTVYGEDITYRWTSIESDNNHTFSLNFEDTKYLEIYRLVKTYDLYNRLKCFGYITPRLDYIEKKILHDQFSIYKFILGEDGETIIHWAKLWGVYFTNVPRSSMNDINGSLELTLNFSSAFVEDMDPMIIKDFNHIVGYSKFTEGTSTYNVNYLNNQLPVYDPNIEAVNNEWASIPFIISRDDIESYTGKRSIIGDINPFKYYKLKYTNYKGEE